MSTANDIKLAALKREIAVGIKALDRGRFQAYDDAKQLVNDICRHGKMGLNALRPKFEAKVQKKK